MRGFEACLHADRSHGQEDRERLPDAVVQAVLADGVDVDLVNLTHEHIAEDVSLECGAQCGWGSRLTWSPVGCRPRLPNDLLVQAAQCSNRLAEREPLATRRRTCRSTSRALPAVTSPKTLTPSPGPGKGCLATKASGTLSCGNLPRFLTSSCGRNTLDQSTTCSLSMAWCKAHILQAS